MKKIIFTVTNDLVYDQRMKRICGSLAGNNFMVLLVGRKLKDSPPLQNESYSQKRIFCLFKKGKLFYLEYNFRLFFYLIFKKTDCVCAIDLDTILPCYFISKLKGVKRVYDAHEYFSQLNEVISRPAIYKAWHFVERKMIPAFQYGYTICKSIADEFKKIYGVDYSVIRNTPPVYPLEENMQNKNIILYQGTVNYGRSLDKLVLAMKKVPGILWIIGNGNYMDELRQTIEENNLNDKVVLYGMLSPVELRSKAVSAGIAVNPFESKGLNQYLSLSNKFFDYIHAGIPQVTMNYPEYRNINDQFEVAVLIDKPGLNEISTAIQQLQNDEDLYKKLQANCIKAREEYNWNNEEKKLIAFYKRLLHE